MCPFPLAEFPLRELPVPYNYRVSSDKSTLESGSAVVAAAGTHRNSTKTNVVDMQDGDEDSSELQRKRTVGSGESTPEHENFKRSKSNNHESFRQPNFQCAVESSMDIDGIHNLSELPNDAESLSIPVDDTSAAPAATNTAATAGSDTNININNTAINSINLMEEGALPLSPTASSPGTTTPLAKTTKGNKNNDITDLIESKDSIISPEYLSDEIFSAINNNLPHAYFKNLLFRLVANMDRSELSDLGTLIKDNLKRDLITSLPFEISLKVFNYLQFDDIINSLRVSQSWNKVIKKSTSLWKKLLVSENFVSSEKFNSFNLKLSEKYPKLLQQDRLRLYFLESMFILKNWYNPKFLPQRTTLRGHMTSVITCLQFEDNYVITGADDKMIRIYDSINKKFLLQLSGHDGGVWALKYVHGGILVSGSTDRTVRVWDIKKGCCTHVFKGHNSTVRCLDIVEYKNTKYIVTGSRDNTLHIWKLPEETSTTERQDDYPLVFHTPEENPYFVGVLRGHMASVRTVSGHGNIVVSGSYDNTLIVWDVAQMKCLYILSGHTDRIYSTIYDHKRKRCISASMDSTIRIWDLENIWNNGECSYATNSASPCAKILGAMYTLHGHTALVGLLRLSDKFLVSAAADGSIRGWDANDYSRKFSYHHTNLSAITTFYVSDNILVSGSEGQFNIYNLRSGKLVHSNILKDADQIWSVNFKGKTLVAAVEKDGQSFLEILDFSKMSKINYVSNPANSSSSSLESISTSLGLARTTIIP
ncbi:SCF ubiquitin ligase complex subunit CDC4 [Saccharomyces eubayanus]|uniref:SCF ubiquitin ligase complex subunit CDC4 n=1 Tax=Saccharomyces eubayanus TaxID=1080349 RepID=UPI0006C30F69|nr:CDC4-like protein [Saccharomyces eubayanus]KOG99810.1 CDC4-like protein [Saccharomyces eubayanus]